MKKLLISIFAAIACLFAASAMAFDGSYTGQITQFEVTAAGNMGFRVYQSASGAMCGASSDSYSYMEPTDSNYDTYLSVLMMARILGLAPLVYVTKVGTSAPYHCHVGYVVLPTP